MKVIKMNNSDSDEIKWKKVYTTQNPIDAEIVTGNLESEGIKVVPFNKRDSSYTVFGYIELLVPEDDYDRAMKLISGTQL
jgi:putative signal transducing protein